MATLRIDITEDGSTNFELNFLGKYYYHKIVRLNGEELCDDSLVTQINKELGEFFKDVLNPDEEEELMLMFDEINGDNLVDTIADNIESLSWYERRIREEAEKK